MDDGYSPGELGHKSLPELGGEGDFGDEYERLLALGDGMANQCKIDFSFAAPCDPIKQKRLMTGCDDCRQDGVYRCLLARCQARREWEWWRWLRGGNDVLDAYPAAGNQWRELGRCGELGKWQHSFAGRT